MTSAENARLVVSFEARLNQYFKQLEKMQRDTASKAGAVAKSHDRAAADVQRAWNRPVHLRGVETGLARARRELDGFRASAIRLGGAGLGSVLGAAGVALGGASGVNTLRSMERLSASLETVTGSSKEARAAFDSLQGFAARTPFDIEQVVSAFIKLKALGLDPSQEALLSYGNTASAMGKSLNQMIEAVADAATGEFERLKEFGIRSKSEGDRVSFTFRGVTTNVGKNATEIEAYLRRIGQVEFAGAMERQAETVDGALSNLGDSFVRLVDTIGRAGVTSMLSSIARGIGGAVDAATNAVDKLAKLDTRGDSSILDEIRVREEAIRDLQASPIARLSGTYIENQQAAIAGLRRELLRRRMEDGPTAVPGREEWMNRPPVAVAPDAADKLRGVDDDLAAAVDQLVRDAAKAGHVLTVTSGLRSRERQRELWEAELARNGGNVAAARKLVAPPGSSRHERGDAVDLSFGGSDAARQWVNANLSAYGLAAPVPGERPLDGRHAHLEMAGSRSGGRDKATTDAERQAEAIRRVVDELRFEGAQLQRNSLDQEIAAALRQAGVDAASAEGKAIADLVRQNYALEQARDAASAAQERANEATEEGLGAARDFAGTLLHGLKQGKTFTDSLADAINRLSDRLLNSALDSLFAPASAGAPGGFFASLLSGGSAAAGAGAGGLLGGMILPGILHGGGIAGRTAVPGRLVPASAFANAPRLHSGIRPGEYAAILEEGERVATELQTRREAAAMGALTNFAKGGARNRTGGPSVTMPTTYNIDARGSEMKREDFEAIVARNNRALEARIPAIVQRHQMDRT